jgi:hypothetical protein
MMSDLKEDSSIRASLEIDRKIASLLAAIEQEKIPDRLTKLAIDLQNALAERRWRETDH